MDSEAKKSQEYFMARNKLFVENQALKQTLDEIRKCCENDAIEVNTKEYGNLVVVNCEDILQIIEHLNPVESKEIALGIIRILFSGFGFIITYIGSYIGITIKF